MFAQRSQDISPIPYKIKRWLQGALNSPRSGYHRDQQSARPSSIHLDREFDYSRGLAGRLRITYSPDVAYIGASPKVWYVDLNTLEAQPEDAMYEALNYIRAYIMLSESVGSRNHVNP